MGKEQLVLDGSKSGETIMVGSHRMALGTGGTKAGSAARAASGTQPAVIWWREAEHSEESAVMFRPPEGEAKELDRGIVNRTNLAAGPGGGMLAVWEKASPERKIRVYACDPLSASTEPSASTEAVALSGPGASDPVAAIDAEGNAMVAWARLEGRDQVIEGVCRAAGTANWSSSFIICAGTWASRPSVCGLEGGRFFIAWDELAPEGGSIRAKILDPWGQTPGLTPGGTPGNTLEKTLREIAVFPEKNQKKPGLRYGGVSCAPVDGKILIVAVRIEDVISKQGIIDQHHDAAAALIEPGTGKVGPLPSPANLDHGLLNDPDLKTNVWGFMGNRLKPQALSGGRVCWERKERHDGFTDTEGALGVLCFKDLDKSARKWGPEMILHRGSHAYEVKMTGSGSSWVLHRPILWGRTQQLVVEEVRQGMEEPSTYQWLRPKSYAPIEFPMKKRERNPEVELGGKKLRLYWGDTHVHSAISIDPEGEPDELLHYARDLARLDWVAITDNDSLYQTWLNQWDRIRGSELAEIWTEDGKFVALDGFEYTRPEMGDTTRNHRTVLVPGRGGKLFRWSDRVREDERDRVKGSDYRDPDGLAAAAERIGALLICHHGDWYLSDSDREVGIEASSSWDTYFHNAEPVRKLWNTGRRVCLVGGSDGHRRNAGLGGACTGVWAEELTHEGVLDAIARRRTIATQGRRPLVEFELKDTEGSRLFIGGFGKLTGGLTARIRVMTEPGYEDRIELIELLNRERTLANWSTAETEDGGRLFDIEYQLRGSDSIAKQQALKLTAPMYLYLRIRFSGPDYQFPSNVAPARGPWAWTTPIWWE
ncbi:MAG TPA: hypothetical protein VMX75_10720 [Spirochaetia bacterium]|nr:hypothetical protein [Spirochaetia bacterium]